MNCELNCELWCYAGGSASRTLLLGLVAGNAILSRRRQPHSTPAVPSRLQTRQGFGRQPDADPGRS